MWESAQLGDNDCQAWTCEPWIKFRSGCGTLAARGSGMQDGCRNGKEH